MSDESTVKTLLKARFQQLAEEQEDKIEMPPELRKEVFRSLDKLDEVENVADLLTGKSEEATAAFIDRIEDAAPPPVNEA